MNVEEKIRPWITTDVACWRWQREQELALRAGSSVHPLVKVTAQPGKFTSGRPRIMRAVSISMPRC